MIWSEYVNVKGVVAGYQSFCTPHFEALISRVRTLNQGFKRPRKHPNLDSSYYRYYPRPMNEVASGADFDISNHLETIDSLSLERYWRVAATVS